jgi:hypothetical protein
MNFIKDPFQLKTHNSNQSYIVNSSICLTIKELSRIFPLILHIVSQKDYANVIIMHLELKLKHGMSLFHYASYKNHCF